MLDALHDGRYRRLWLAGLCVNVARWMDFLVLGWIVLELTGSPLLVGVAAFCRSAPMMALGLFAGVLADRFHRGRLMVLVQSLNLTAALVLALLFGTGRGGLLPLVALEALLGIAWALDFSARRTVLYTLVGPGRVTNATSLESVAMQGSKMIGTFAGGLLLARVGASGCYVVLALLYLVALLLTMWINRRVDLPGSGSVESVVASLAAGLREVRTVPAIRAVLIITIIMNALVFPYQQLMSVFARDVLEVGPELLGLLVAAEGLGALGGALLLASWHSLTAHGRVFVGGSLLLAVLVVGFSLSSWYALSLPLEFAIGLASSGFGTMQSAIMLLSASERARGRAMGILSACIGTQPLGTLWVGFFASRVGAPAATAAGAALALLLMLPLAIRMATPAPRPPDAGR